MTERLLIAARFAGIVICSAMWCGAGVAHADDLRIVTGGWSYHFVSASERAPLNQNQHTWGIEWNQGPWSYQMARMEDSFGCPAWHGVATYRWPLMSAGWVSAGVGLGLLAAHRCTDYGTTTTRFTSPARVDVPHRYPHALRWRWRWHAWQTVDGARVVRHMRWRYSVELPCACHSRAHWVIMPLPTAYLNLGSRCRIEVSAFLSPWSRHVIAYAQFSLLLWRSP